MIFIIFLLLIILIISGKIYLFGGFKEDTVVSPNFEPYYERKLSSKKEPYDGRPRLTKICLKGGQLKLLLNELEFYTNYGREHETVLYIGSAPGHHQDALLDLFPNWEFHLYDPRVFSAKIIKKKNARIHQQYFTDEEAEKIKAKFRGCLFLSDIRTGAIEEHEEEVQINMVQQRKWCEIIKPRLAMLKFRLPWRSGKVSYFDGEIYTQPYTGPVSTETRLVTDFKMTEYDNDEYNDRCFYWQKNQRMAFHEFDLPDILGIDHCYDCWSFTKIVREYLASKFSNKSDEKTLMEKIINSCRCFLNTPPHGEYPEERDIWLKMKKLEPVTLSYLDSKQKMLIAQTTGEKTIECLVKKKLINVIDVNVLKTFKYLIYARAENLAPIEIKPDSEKEKIFAKVKPNLSIYLHDSTPAMKPRELRPYEYWCMRHYGLRNYLSLIRLASISKTNKILVISCDFTATFYRAAILFPQKKFFFYTTHNIQSGYEKYKNIFIYQYLPTIEELKLKFRRCSLMGLFFTDSADLAKGLAYQREVCEALTPEKFLLGIRKDTVGEFEYFDGNLFIPPWQDADGHLLMIEGSELKLRKWNFTKIMQQFFFFNLFIRPSIHRHDVPTDYINCSSGTIDYCWDCWCSQFIWRHFIETQKYSKTSITDLMTRTASNDDINILCLTPHGMDPLEKNIERKIAKLAPYTLFRRGTQNAAYNYAGSVLGNFQPNFKF